MVSMAENRKGKEKRYYFSRGQFILLGCGFTVASVIIFFLGMLVGQGIEERKIVKPAEPLMKIPIKPTQGSHSSPLSPKEEITFYDTLTTRSATAHGRVEEEVRETKKAEKTVKGENREASKDRKLAPKQELAPVAKRSEDRAGETGKKNQSDDGEAKQSGKLWTVQVNAFPDEKTAKTWVDRLKDRGYNAYLSESRVQGRLWYRVRVGRFESREEAEKTQESLRKREQLAKSFATNR
jgi:cell division septation protein DedD